MTSYPTASPWNKLNFNPAFYTAGSFTKPLWNVKDYSQIFTNGTDTTYNSSAQSQPAPAPPSPNTDSAGVPDMSSSTDAQIQQWIKTLPIFQQAQQTTLDQQLAFNQKSMEQMYPWLSQAANEATLRNLGASKSFAYFKDLLPTSAQARAASIQGQIATAANAEAQRQYAIAAQKQTAVTPFRYAGQGIQVAFG